MQFSAHSRYTIRYIWTTIVHKEGKVVLVLN
jgi:hypothetical protein